jgi:predicted Holliday junction resolvase-like endonuclease
MKRLQQRQQKVTENIISSFKRQFNGEPIEFETSWPITKFDTLQTGDMDFLVELDLKTGKVIQITEYRS